MRLIFALFAALTLSVCQAAGTMTFTVSMDHPESHLFHVKVRCDGLTGELQDFKLPQWSPGYYGIGNYARYVSNFRAEDGAGHALDWEKVARQTWRVVAANAPVIVLHYDVFANIAFAANSYLGEDRAYISPSGIFVYPEGGIHRPVRVEIDLPANWNRISTGLEPLKGKPGAFDADNFDVLYDSPILMGNQEYLHFDVKGVPHYVAIENVAASVDRGKMIADLKAMVAAATNLMGDVPYKHYTFLMMGRGAGGIEHANSSSNQFDGNSLTTPAGYLRWLSFICHEYFHNFNVKRIRPLALGPFDYEQENLTNMLWVSEGLSVYYEDLILVRAGLMSDSEYLGKLANAIGTFESSTGRRYQSATESSQNTWNAGSGIGGDRNTTISYYNNGAMLGAMLDLKIRTASGNRKSLDDVMRGLYRKYYLQRKRGFTDREFRAECESASGASLAEVFEYASTSKEVDYARYFAMAGLKLEVSLAEAIGSFIGLDTRTEEIPPVEITSSPQGGRGGRGGAPLTRLIVTDTVPDSPAEKAGFQSGDRITEVNGTPAANASALHEAINARKPGEQLTIRVVRGTATVDVPVGIAANLKRTYRLSPAAPAGEAETSIRNAWLHGK